MASDPFRDFPWLALVDDPTNSNIVWAPHVLEATNQQRAEIIELSHTTRSTEFDELDDFDWELIEEAAREVEDAAISLAHEFEIDDQLARMGPSVLELAFPTKETIEMAYIPDFGAYDRSTRSATYEEPLDRAARNSAKYGYDPDEYDIKEPEQPIIAGGEVERMEWMDQVHKENPLLDMASARIQDSGFRIQDSGFSRR